MRFNKAGSLWGQWDLHFHTPSSFDYENKSVTNEQLIQVLKSVGVVAVAVTDHHRIDVARVREMQKLAGDDLTVFPGIEFRSELGGKDKVHYIGVFPEDCNLEDLWTILSGKVGLTPGQIAEMGGDQAAYFDCKDTSNIIRELGGIVTAHAGTKSNTIESIGGNDPSKLALKADLLRDYVDLFELGKPSDKKAYDEIVFPAVGRKLPQIICSDNHNIHTYERKARCWIKGDRSFRTFQQLKNDVMRAYIGDLPPELARVDANKTKYIEWIEFRKAPSSTLDEEWFSGTVPLNSGLVSVIGNKGSGKTALAESIALLGNCELSKDFTFLHDHRFRKGKHSKAAEFEAKMKWLDGHVNQARLSESVDELEPASVSFIPQNYLETICNEVQDTDGGKFDAELKSVIFSHVPPAKQLGQPTLDALLNYLTEPILSRIVDLREELGYINEEIGQLLSDASDENKQMLLGLKASKERELSAHKNSRPAIVPKPDSDPSTQAAMEALREEIAVRNKERSALADAIKVSQEIIRASSARSAAAARILQTMENLQASFDSMLDSIKLDCSVLGIAPSSIAQLTVNSSQVVLSSNAAVERSELEESKVDAAEIADATLQSEIESLTEKLDAPNATYQRYLDTLQEWQERRDEIIGSELESESLTHLTSIIKSLDDLPARLAAKEQERAEKAGEIYEQIGKRVKIYSDLYKPVQDFITNHPIAKGLFHLEFNASIVFKDTDRIILENINQGRKGSFAGQDEGRRAIQMLESAADVSTKEGALSLAKEILDRCNADYRSLTRPKTRVSEQLAQGATVRSLFDAIFGFEYLTPKYKLKWSGKELGELSPGERGTLLLIFYLLIDKRDNPLIIDQPEENLDNETVVKVLVPCMREARSKRQVIMVTHNPNLAVVCDADQIIHSQLDKKAGNKVTYTTGALENPELNKYTVDVLEGTRPAFDQRGAKYQLDTL